jgi:MFS family permease
MHRHQMAGRMTDNGAEHAEPDDGSLASFRSKSFLYYWMALLFAGFSVQIQTVAVGWQIYAMTRDPLNLGLVGLSQFLPALLLVLVTGSASDRFSRRTILAVCLLAESVCALGFLLFTISGSRSVWPLFLILIALGTARAFYNPARQSIVPNLVPDRHVPNAITLSVTAGQFATVAGPVAGGLLFAVAPGLAYGLAMALLFAAGTLVLLIRLPRRIPVAGYPTWESLSAGFRYIWTEKVVLGAVTLDLFAVLLGGAVALLPVYALEVLDVGPTGLGLLKAGPAIGGIAVGFYLMANPIRDHAGRIMFAAVAGFGVFTAVFALSETVWISVLALVLIGGCDMISVFVRNTLVQLWTPDELRGRVNAVNQVFVGASNELGAFRAGTSAALIGAVPAVLLGGIGTVAVAGLWLHWFPGLRRTRHLAPPSSG